MRSCVVSLVLFISASDAATPPPPLCCCLDHLTRCLCSYNFLQYVYIDLFMRAQMAKMFFYLFSRQHLDDPTKQNERNYFVSIFILGFFFLFAFALGEMPYSSTTFVYQLNVAYYMCPCAPMKYCLFFLPHFHTIYPTHISSVSFRSTVYLCK